MSRLHDVVSQATYHFRRPHKQRMVNFSQSYSSCAPFFVCKIFSHRSIIFRIYFAIPRPTTAIPKFFLDFLTGGCAFEKEKFRNYKKPTKTYRPAWKHTALLEIFTFLGAVDSIVATVNCDCDESAALLDEFIFELFHEEGFPHQSPELLRNQVGAQSIIEWASKLTRINIRDSKLDSFATFATLFTKALCR